MTLYKISSKISYINCVTDFIKAKYAEDLSSLIVILPNGYICSYVQKYFIQKYGASILPHIITLNEIGNTCLINRFKPENVFQMISPLEERVILSKIIQDYNKLKYNILDSINTSTILSDLFYEFELNQIDYHNLEKMKGLHDSHHWSEIYDFISYVYEKWEQKLLQIKKLSKAKFLIKNLDIVINSIKQQKNINVLVAGFVGDNNVIFNFIKSIYKECNVDYILPPTGNIDVDKMQNIKPHEGLYNIVKFFEYLEITTENVQLLETSNCAKQINLDSVLLQNDCNNDVNTGVNDQDYEYIEFKNIFDEAEFIANKCTTLAYEDSKIRIAIIINDSKCKEYYAHFLDKYVLSYRDLIGIEVHKSNIVSLVYSVATILCNPFNINNFLNIIDHPLIISNQSVELKYLLMQRTQFVNVLEDIQEAIEDSASYECKEYFATLKKMIDHNVIVSHSTMNDLLSKIIGLINSIKPQIFASADARKESKILEIFNELLSLKHDLPIENVHDFPDILLNILKDIKIYKPDTGANIILARDQDISLINFDYIFFTNFSDGASPPHEMHHPFLSSMMQEEMELNLSTKNISSAWYNFYLNIQNSNVMMTMSKKQGGKSIAKTSQFLLKLEYIIGAKLKKQIGSIIYDNHLSIHAKDQISFESFPNTVSATDIETLIKAPYNFYAKKILKLKPCDDLDESPNLSIFGNIFHKVAEIYTNSYDNLNQDRVSSYNDVIDRVLSAESYPEHNVNIWKTKLLAIRDEFIDFDQTRRCEIDEIYTEREGKMILNINNHNVEIKAIADRVEINKRKNIAYILDYKTGAIPTKISVESGMSPQLIIYALIMMEGGFGIDINSVPKLVYVKIGSSAPYINITEFVFSKEELMRHKQGLVSLLEYYIENKRVPIMPNLLQYDDYAHLARRV